MPLVTVVIPAYNHEHFIGEAVESVLCQTVDDWEMIVVDDGSTDGTNDIVRQYSDQRLRLIRQPNFGAHAALNRGITEARGEWIAFLNSDDRFRRDKLECHLQIHGAAPDIEASASRVRYIDELGVPLARYSYYSVRYRSMRRVASRAPSLFLSLMISNHLITTSSLFVRRSTLFEVGGFAGFRYVHDWFMFLSLAARQKFVVIEDDLSDYRRHQGNTIREDDVRGQIEDNLALAWQVSVFMEKHKNSVELREVFMALRQNPRVDFELLWLFGLLRLSNSEDISQYLGLFRGQDDPLLRTCYKKIQRKSIRKAIRRLRQKIDTTKELGKELFDRRCNP